LVSANGGRLTADGKQHMAGAETIAGAACGRREDGHRFPDASVLREKAKAIGAKACQRSLMNE